MNLRRNTTRLVALAAALAALLAACGGGGSDGGVLLPPSSTIRPSPTAVPESPPGETASPSPEPGSPPPDGMPQPTGGPDGGPVDLLRVVDKGTALPPGYVPDGLASVPDALAAPGFGGQLLARAALDALSEMLDAADGAGYDVRVRSAYRSYEEQERTFQYWVSQLGEEQARRVSAEPGHSEHQLGTAADLTAASAAWDLTEGFGGTAEGRWLATHAHEYGFALSYPEGEEAVTGYAYEPWHFRYIGREAARRWHESGLTLVEFLRAQ